MEREDIKMLVKKWWDVYDDESLDYKNTMASLDYKNTVASKKPKARAEQRNLKSFFATLSEAVGITYFTAPSAA